jgi:hypothetical protein
MRAYRYLYAAQCLGSAAACSESAREAGSRFGYWRTGTACAIRTVPQRTGNCHACGHSAAAASAVAIEPTDTPTVGTAVRRRVEAPRPARHQGHIFAASNEARQAPSHASHYAAKAAVHAVRTGDGCRWPMDVRVVTATAAKGGGGRPRLRLWACQTEAAVQVVAPSKQGAVLAPDHRVRCAAGLHGRRAGSERLVNTH